MRSDINLRAAKPELNDGLLFARYMNLASDGFFNIMLGENSEKIISDAFLSPKHTLSYEYVTFAEKEGVVIGMISAFTGAQHREFSEEPLEMAASSVSLRMKFMRFILSPIFNILSTIKENDYYLQGIAVEPNYRGQGVGSILMCDIDKRALNSGSSRICLDVAANNSSAQKMYKSRGMVEVSKWPRNKILPSLFIRMAVKL